MGKSVKEYIPAILRWWWVMVVFMIGDVAGIALTMWQNIKAPFWVWILVFIIGLVVAQFFTFHDLRKKRDELQNQLDEIRDARPNMETRIRKQHDDFDIEVLNKGEDAEFEAQVEVVSGRSFVVSLPQTYSAYWEKTKNDKIELKKGQKNWLKIASLQVGTTPTPLMNFRLHYYEITYWEVETYPRVAYANSTAWIPGNTHVVKPCVSLKVTISSNPSMIDGAFIRTYELSDKGLSETNS